MGLLSGYGKRKRVEYSTEDIPKDAKILEVGCGEGWFKKSRGLGLKEIVVFSALLATLFHICIGYFYGNGNHEEHLPMIYRVLDTSYLSNDFFVNASADFGPRTYYVHLLGLLGSYIELPLVFLVLTWVSSFALIMVTYLAAKDLFDGYDVGAMLACVFVMGTRGAILGDTGRLSQVYLLPGHLTYPLVLSSLWCGLRGRAIMCSVLASVASAIHPLIGLEVGGISLVTAGASVFLFEEGEKKLWSRSSARKLGAVLLGGCVLCMAVLVLWAGRVPKTLDTKQFVEIVAHFRHPHHYIPSSWGYKAYVFAGLFLVAFGVSWKWWCDELSERRYIGYRILVPVVIVLLLWCGGYFFVEVVPSRLWTTAQTFRLVFLINWLGLVVIGRTVGRLLGGDDALGKACGCVIIMGSGSALPVLAVIGHIVEILRRKMKSVFSREGKGAAIALVILGGGVFASKYGSREDGVAMLGFIAVVSWFLLVKRSWYRGAVPGLVLIVLVGGIIVDMNHTLPVLSHVMGRINVNVTSTRRSYLVDEIAVHARRLTPEDAVFLTPPLFSRFRIVAGRAIVVDWKCIVFQDAGMLEWRRRMGECFGEVKAGGDEGRGEMEMNYGRITERKLSRLADKYGASYAVLYKGTRCRFPLVAENRQYKIVRLREHP